ncbi:response regulator [Alkalitalea saponilacus]|uniref:DNA-binding response regulator, NarL/FixJ family, contains REC and HTH domains n=1 Tax=Alkalitalea saponilacus TaxID=889453 RepID=A0A1T5ATJ2_9BACT|nr:response regulator transcription factor [Alkalitalea saponilacus]ASB48601.1 DNA-binding response regulator [Alkalitalea saponilacus]SKB38235.1 DNA-binding response regulator, NarL/FixJ family, contains REC and HTH domains [Alkalitalea saponilacus]
MRRIIIADDHAVVRTGLQLILNETDDLSLCAEATNGEELIKLIINDKFDLLILDASMPGKDGLDLLIDVKKINPELPVIIFTMNNDSHYAVRMIRAGASAYINKETDTDLILNAIRKVLQGKHYFLPEQSDLLEDILNLPQSLYQLPHEQLSDREFQIMFLLSSGLKNGEIAAKLKISKNTVANHRTSILKKMNLENNAELTRYAIQHGIIN